MKQTDEQKYSLLELEDEELEYLNKFPSLPANGYWIVDSQAFEGLEKEFEKYYDDLNPTLIYKGDVR